MMSEHRYGVHDCPNGLYYLRDVTDHSVYVHRNYGKLYSDYKDDIELVSVLLNELADKVDERQATINKLKEENEQLRHEIEIEKKWQLAQDKYYVKIKEENEQLRKELDSFKPIMFKNMQKGTIILYSKGGIDE